MRRSLLEWIACRWYVRRLPKYERIFLLREACIRSLKQINKTKVYNLTQAYTIWKYPFDMCWLLDYLGIPYAYPYGPDFPGLEIQADELRRRVPPTRVYQALSHDKLLDLITRY